MGRFKTILGEFWQALPVFLLAFAGFALLCLAFPFFVLLCLALPCGTHFELEVQLACISLPCFVFLCLALPCLALLCLGLPGFTLPCLASPCLALLYSCAFRSIATQVLPLSWALFSLLWRIFSIFLRILSYLAFLSGFFRFLERFFEAWGGFGQRFWEVFSMISGAYIEKHDFVKISVSPRREQENQGFEL